MVVALLADPQALSAALQQSGALAADANVLSLALQAGSLPADLAQALSHIGDGMATLLQGGGADLLQQGQLTRAAVADAQAGAGVAAAYAGVVGGAVTRLHASAARGVAQVVSAAAQQVLLLRAGRAARVFAGRSGRLVSLDREYAGIVNGSYVLLDKPDYSELFRVAATSQSSRAEFAISGKSSSLSLSGQNLALFDDAVRQTTVFGRSEVLARARAPLLSAVSGALIQVAADVSGLQPGRRLIIKGPSASNGSNVVHHATLLAATPAAHAADGGSLHFDPPLPQALRRDATVVYGNVALASHGETVTQVLGSGDAAQPFQRFELKHAPLTHRAAASETGAAAEITLRVADVAWTLRPTLYGAAAKDRAYTLHTDEQQRVSVQFGDGQLGARPASGINNIRATYRKGLGTAGNVRAETLTQPMTRPLGLKSVANLAPALGGTDPEGPAATRRSMPLQTRTLGRAVSLLDYEDFARAYAGVAKAKAAVLPLTGGATVCVTVAGEGGALLGPANPLWAALLAALRDSGDPHVPLRLLAHAASTFRVGLKVKVDTAYESSAVLAAVQNALRAHFSFDARELGQPVHQSELMAVVHGVPGVLALDLDCLYGGSAPASQTVPSRQTRLLATRLHAAAGRPFAAEMLTLDAAPFDRLELMS